MEGLRTTRVLVIDDQRVEAQGVLDALARDGIGAIYYSQDVDNHPEQPLTGVRLAIVDMNLDDLTAPESPAATTTILSVLNRLIAGQNGPYLAIAWTKHRELVEEFAARAAELPCPPVRVIPLVKADFKDEDGSFDSKKIACEVQKALDKCYPLGLLAFWEQMVHESSGSIMEMMPEGNGWIDGSKRTLALLCKCAAGEGDPQDVKLRALLEAFNSLQFDTMESDTALLDTETATKLVNSLQIEEAPPKGSDLAARLNQRLLFGVTLPDAAPGNIYKSEAIGSAEEGAFPALDELLNDMAHSGKQQELKEAGSLAVAMEITPLCDYQQKKVRRARFVCGIAVRSDKGNLVKKADFVRKIPEVCFENGPLRGNMIMTWNSHFIVSVPPDQVPQGEALVRLRQSPLMDFQSWIGSHATRPGYLSVW
ncbi:MAG: hypothetical protein OXO50_15900 [Caldilineaceae bacterium]|nr:hypothetical protein [Caldilineaceae bacterium]